MLFYYVLMLFIKYGFKQEFTPSKIPDVQRKPEEIMLKREPNIYLTEDTRMEYPLIPPVNPNVKKRIISETIPANSDLFTSQTYESSDSILDTPPTENTNQLVYSGGETKMIKIPLQFNYPYDEQLRSQDVLITPYNKVKFGNC